MPFTPKLASIFRWASKSPCNANTPIRGAKLYFSITDLPAATSHQLLLGQGIQVNPNHWLTQVSGYVCQNAWILVMGRGTHDSLGTCQRIARFENARANEDTFCAQSHH